ncbi:MAG: aminomethyl-transferring glycine dehydrogenase subunit GcvPA [Candidatus Aeolococcus gillhamiae]|uniref:Probable glycine dehydrogenase (decarboxylating) subunit 1 n=1 Tax=Candidatus Aeolococcus gillhamiae TaxID=3127015 RepID=A0A2W5Z4D5_9BACT|nr:MAG: aminomethyl-transferring glycine dehydrogenase subunit GcvPA [Candidatus Dormibacter sp. RRmetagenome_bin12]
MLTVGRLVATSSVYPLRGDLRPRGERPPRGRKGLRRPRLTRRHTCGVAYLPNSDADRTAMLEVVGAGSVSDLFATIPASLRDPTVELPPPLGEQDLVAEVERLAARNHPLSELDNFLGAGVYSRFIPAIVRGTIGRPEFYTAYTPYQAEASQGTLQTIFEFQSMICALTGLDVANASLYDGATAAAEAMMLAVQATGRDRIAVSGAVHPETLRVLRTFAAGRSVSLDVVAARDDVTSIDDVRATLDERHAGLLVQQPTFFGTLETLAGLAEAAHAVGALALCSADPLACTVLVPPADAGFDVCVGDGQPLGVPASFGGPHVGYMAVRQALVRRMPGRLVGITNDHAGRRAYALTLQTREQHIRREHATSNICTNHALVALAATVYMAHMGAGGMREVATVSAQRAHHLADELCAVKGFSLASATPFLWEFVLRCPADAAAVAAAMRDQGIVAGLPLGRVDAARADELLVCCTEMTSRPAIDRFVAALTALDTAALPQVRQEVAV